jgi:non-homologous end joining protein Ku
MIMVGAFFIVGFAFTFLIFAIIHFLRRIRDDKDKIRNHGEEDLVVEALDVPPRAEKKKQEPEPKGYSRRIRRRFRKLIRSRADPEVDLSPLTPAELARSAGIPEGEPAAQIHAVYEKARYSPDAVGKEDYLALKEAIEAIET